MSIDLDAILRWFQEQPSGTAVELNALARQFDVRPEHLRDRLHRLVEQGTLDQSEQVPGLSDGNPSYQLTAPPS